MLRRSKGLSKLCLLLALLLFFLSINVSTVEMSFSDSLGSVNRSISQSYMVHSPILITSDGELAAAAVNGTGAVNAPYILANWNITGSLTHGIYITGTTKHFRIENCWIDSSSNHGIYVFNVPTGTATIVNNTCYRNIWDGISLYISSSSIISNNICHFSLLITFDYNIWVDLNFYFKD